MKVHMDTFCNDVNDWLIVGADLLIGSILTEVTEQDVAAWLMSQGVTHVIDARIECCDDDIWTSVGLPAENYGYFPVTDSFRHRVDEGWFVGVEDFVQGFLAQRSEGDKLYVHCHMGVNRGPSAAMLALLTADPSLDPWDAFLAIRHARAIAGLVYAEQVGIRHLVVKVGGSDDKVFSAMNEYRKRVNDYWTYDAINEVNRGVAYYRDDVIGTRVVA
jgi:hypothetical protein